MLPHSLCKCTDCAAAAWVGKEAKERGEQVRFCLESAVSVPTLCSPSTQPHARGEHLPD